MQWKKINMTDAELERKQQYYKQEALFMMKRAVPAAEGDSQDEQEIEAHTDTETVTETEPLSVPEAEPMPAEQNEEKNLPPDGAVGEEAAAENTGEETVVSDPSGGEASPAPDSSETATGHEAAGSENYGVYTAGQILSGEYKGDGLESAAKMLEEMADSTRIMKEFAGGGRGSKRNTQGKGHRKNG